jgi:hypothetical protein
MQPQNYIEQHNVEQIVDSVAPGKSSELAPLYPGTERENAGEPKVHEKTQEIGYRVGHIHLHLTPKKQAIESIMKSGGHRSNYTKANKTAFSKRGEAH